jgi:two-component system nitrate/nitrite response regulator NarL
MNAARQKQIRQGQAAAEPLIEIVSTEFPNGDACPEEIRVAIATDLRLYRDVLARILARGERIEVVGMAAKAQDAVLIVDEVRPDVLLLDAAIPDGSRAVEEIVEASADTKVVVIALPASDDDIIAYAAAGASGFVSRTGSSSELLVAIESAARGEIRYPPEVAATWRGKILAPDARRNAAGRQPHLTRRELQVVELIDRGLSNKEIAQTLAITVPTVKNHFHAILRKLAVRRRTHAAAKVRQWRVRESGGHQERARGSTPMTRSKLSPAIHFGKSPAAETMADLVFPLSHLDREDA